MPSTSNANLNQSGDSENYRSRSPKKAKSAKDLVKERTRIEIAMAQLEAAKLKANAQRAEYGRFLQWKVDMQRKERKQREEEGQQLRLRVEKKLSEVLKEHREQRKQETRSYRQFAEAKAPKPTQLKLATSYDREAAILAEAQFERERKRLEWEKIRSEMGPRTAPAGGRSNKSNTNLTADTVKAAVNIQRKLNQQANPYIGQTPRAPNGLNSAPTQILNAHGEEEYDAALLQDKVGHVEGLVNATRPHNEGETAAQAAMRDTRLKTLEETEKKKSAVHKRIELMESMFNKARTRRLFAQQRIAADPPADYLIGTDILRYIPADLIPGGSQFMAPGDQPRKHAQVGGDNAFFMTAVNNSYADFAPPDISADAGGLQPSPPHDGSSPQSPRADMASKTKRRLRQFDPQPWVRRDLGDVVPEIRQQRVPEEEAIMYEWYKTQESSQRHASWKDKQHSWNHRTQDKHTLPPVRSMKLDTS